MSATTAAEHATTAAEHVAENAGHAAEHTAEAAGHAAEHVGGVHIPELQNVIDYALHLKHISIWDDAFGHGLWGLSWFDMINIVFACGVILILSVLAIRLKAKLQRVPKGFQALVEVFVNGMNTYFSGIMGAKWGRVFTPFVGTLFIYILFMNYLGLIPFAKSPIAANINVPMAMAICVFFLVQYHGIRQNGLKNYCKHFLGEKAGIIGLDQFLMCLNLMLHILGELVKPVSLTLRLFANITAEDAVLASLVIMVVSLPWWLPIPLQAVFFPLALLFGLIQAVVFSTLSALYISLMSAHEEHGHDAEH
ncbi:MAG TPA: F0F1 ATP synthase subunit A [bacterium]|nr:F0F1 ATP synthase subunit A [bacterium]